MGPGAQEASALIIPCLLGLTSPPIPSHQSVLAMLALFQALVLTLLPLHRPFARAVPLGLYFLPQQKDPSWRHRTENVRGPELEGI